jgi:hypothetical protein
MLLLDAPNSLFSLSQSSSDIRFGDEPGCVTHRSRRLLTQKWIFSPAYYFTVGTSGKAMKCYVISAGLLLDYLQTSLCIPIYQTAVGIISPLELAIEASNFQYKLWGNHDLSAASNYLYLFVWAMVCILFILYFKPSETELKCKIGFRTYIVFACYHIQTVGD